MKKAVSSGTVSTHTCACPHIHTHTHACSCQSHHNKDGAKEDANSWHCPPVQWSALSNTAASNPAHLHPLYPEHTLPSLPAPDGTVTTQTRWPRRMPTLERSTSAWQSWHAITSFVTHCSVYTQPTPLIP